MNWSISVSLFIKFTIAISYMYFINNSNNNANFKYPALAHPANHSAIGSDAVFFLPLTLYYIDLLDYVPRIGNGSIIDFHSMSRPGYGRTCAHTCVSTAPALTHTRV